MGGRGSHCRHQAGRTATIDPAILRHVAQQGFDIETLFGIAAIMHEGYLAGEVGARQQFAIGGGFRRPRAVEQPIMAAEAVQLAPHGQQRRDADAASDQDVGLGIRLQVEIVAGRIDIQQIPGLDHVMHEGRATAPVIGFQDAQLVAMGFAGVIAHRILPREAIGQMDHQMGAGGKSRQGAATRADQLKALDAAGLRPDLGDAQLQFIHLLQPLISAHDRCPAHRQFL